MKTPKVGKKVDRHEKSVGRAEESPRESKQVNVVIISSLSNLAKKLPQSMADLLVDFPHRRIQRQVHFAATNQVAMTESPTEEEKAILWYSNQEHDIQKKLFRNDAIRMAKRLSSATMSSIGKDELYQFIGMEVSSTRGIGRFLCGDTANTQQSRRC